MPSMKLTINLPDSLRQKLKLEPWGHRQTTNAICKAIDRYTVIMSSVKREIKDNFSLAELNSLFEIAKTCKLFPADDAFNQLMNKCTDIDQDLLKKLNDLDYVEQFALLELLEDCAD